MELAKQKSSESQAHSKCFNALKDAAKTLVNPQTLLHNRYSCIPMQLTSFVLVAIWWSVLWSYLCYMYLEIWTVSRLSSGRHSLSVMRGFAESEATVANRKRLVTQQTVQGQHPLATGCACCVLRHSYFKLPRHRPSHMRIGL